MNKRPFVTGLLLAAVLGSITLSTACGGKVKATLTAEPTSITQPVPTATVQWVPEVQPAAALEPTVTPAPGATPRPMAAAATRAAAVEATATPERSASPDPTPTPGTAPAPVTLDELEIPDVVIEAGPVLGDLGGFGAGSVVIPTDLMGGLDLSAVVDRAP